MGLPVLSGAQIVRVLGKVGYEAVSQRGSHLKLRRASDGRVVIVPMPKELRTGTLRSILRQAAAGPDELIALL